MKKTVLLLCGGKSDEHEISLISAKGVLDALDPQKYQPLLIGISKKGVWHLQDPKTFYLGEFRADKIRLNENAPTVLLQPFVNNEKKGTLIVQGKTYTFDLAFPILHGPFGEDGTIQGLFETLGIPYVGATHGSSWICRDKVLTKTLCQRAGIRVADFCWLNSIEEFTLKTNEISKLGFPLFIKPPRQGSSVGITRVQNETELFPAIKKAFQFDSKCLIEKAVRGRELECAVLGLKNSAKVAVPGEVVPHPKIGWYTYEGKYLLEDGAQILIPAPLTSAQVKKIQDFAVHVFQTLEIDGMARVDLFYDEAKDEIYLNEPNTIPGFTPISMYPKMWQASGLSYQNLITELLQLAEKRIQN